MGVLDDTKGWGTFQFEKATVRALAAFEEAELNGMKVHHIFGEGGKSQDEGPAGWSGGPGL